MGSPDAEYGRQLNGMGGGVSSLSKAVIVGPPTQAQRADGIDCVYTFVQVGIRDAVLDLSGNCGNLSSMVGVFALDEQLAVARTEHEVDGDHPDGPRRVKIRSLNTNTNKIIDTTFPTITDSRSGATVATLDLPETTIAGVEGKASQITLDFVNPAGARTGKLLPSGSPTDTIEVATPDGSTASLRASLVDATNPTVFVSEDDLRRAFQLPEDAAVDYSSDAVRTVMESVRMQGATRMGLDPAAQAQPKVAALSAPAASDTAADIVIRAFSMGVLHKAVPMTVGLCLGVASGVQGTLAADIVRETRERRGGLGGELVSMRHPGGTVEVGASVDGLGNVSSAKVVRTGRRLMQGEVWW
ncbi:PrpF-like protein [Phanerochaete sordida]|uniref:PrpF-like protein n=1 Tax=Phanerochaete sordida TaxID=48140 RepID=A0A9P3GHS7_9APHY|nr:PrpF-like protein [Phanerochaete sordida]